MPARRRPRSAAAIEQYLDSAVRFVPAPPHGAAARPIRVARTLVTCRVAAAALTELGVPPESGSSYAIVNVHNPASPLFFDADEHRWSHPPRLAEHPVWAINWAGAALLSAHLGARLPTEAEWECFASNNDPARPYPWGDAEPTPGLANFGEHFGGTCDVARFPPSEIGLHDLAGNLFEWCADACGAASDERLQVERVVKGGAWSKDAHHLLIRARRCKWARLGTTTIGFRPVWDD